MMALCAIKKSVKYLGYVLAVFLPTICSADEVKISTQEGLQVSSGDYNFRIGGRIQYDYNRSEKNGITDEDHLGARRARVYVQGAVGSDWEFKSEFNITAGDGVEDLYLLYKGWGKRVQLVIGNHKIPFTLDGVTSSNDISFLQRSSITKRYIIGRQGGMVLKGSPFKDSVYSICAYLDDALVGAREGTEITGFSDLNGDGVRNFSDANNNGMMDTGEAFNEPAVLRTTRNNIYDTKVGFTARYAMALFRTDNSLLHLGIAYNDFYQRKTLGLEAAVVYGAFHAQAEYLDAEERNTDINGYYAQIAYVLTGEVRPYKPGVFKRITPKGNLGAWELVARYEDGDGNFSDIELGRDNASAYGVGLNWYAHKNVRFGINYTHGESDTNNDDGSELRVRAQLTF